MFDIEAGKHASIFQFIFNDADRIISTCGAFRRNGNDVGNQITERKRVPTATSSTTNPTRIDLEPHPGIRGRYSATEFRRYGI
jgi:hypothetical protein